MPPQGGGLIANDDAYMVAEDVQLIVPAPGVLENDTPNVGVTAVLEAPPTNGTLTAGLDPDGSFTYQPNANFNGDDTFTYHTEAVVGGLPSNTATVTITVTSVNDAPDAVGDAATMAEDSPATAIPVLANDTDVDGDTLTITAVTQGANGTVVITGGGTGLTYQPNANFNGSDSFMYTISDGNGGTDMATVNVTVTSVNDPPELAAIGNQNVAEQTKLAFTATATDPNDQPPNNLTFSLSPAPPPGATINASTGEFTWTPTEAQGPASYMLDVIVTDDGSPALSDSETITVTVKEVNRPPVLADIGNRNVAEQTKLAFTATASDPDLPANTLTFSLENGVGGAVPPTASITAGGEFTWTPSETEGPGTYTFDVAVTDSGSPQMEDRETITVTVKEVNLPPTISGVPASATIPEEEPYTFDANATDPDVPANSLAFSLVGAPAGAAIDPGTGVFSWTPTEAQGPGVYEFDVVVTDNGSPPLSDSAHATLTVNEVLTPLLQGVPVDLSGAYFSGSRSEGQPGVARATTDTGAPDGQVVELSAGVMVEREATHTPFSDDLKPPLGMTVDLPGRRVQFDVEMLRLDLWGGASLPIGAAASGDFLEVGVGSETPTGDGNPEVWVTFTKNAATGAPRIALQTDGSAEGAFYQSPANSGETRFLVTLDFTPVAVSGKLLRFDGVSANTEVNLGPMPLDTTNDVLTDAPFFAGFVSFEDASKAKAEAFVGSYVGFNHSGAGNSQYIHADDPYVMPGETIQYRLGMANLTVPVFGFQSFLMSDGPQTFMSGMYTSTPFPNHIRNPIAPGPGGIFELDGEVTTGDPPVQVNRTLAALDFSAGADGSARMTFDTAHIPPSRFGDGSQSGLAAATRDSNIVLVDDTPPTVSVLSAINNGMDVLVGPVAEEGLLEITVLAVDDVGTYSGLTSRPVVEIDFAPAGPGPEDVVLETSSAAGNEFRAAHMITETTPCGPAAISVRATDDAGNVGMAMASFNVNIAEIEVSVTLQGADAGAMTRGIQFKLGGAGPGAAPVEVCKDVDFDNGVGMVTLMGRDGVPCDEPGLTRISAKDRKHTLRRLIALGGGPNSRYTASLTLTGGDASDDNIIDIVDFGILASKFGQDLGRNTLSCDPPTNATSHPDFSGNGIVNSGDYTFISTGWLSIGDAEPGGFAQARPAPKKTVTVAEMAKWVPEALAREFDGNGDGWITYDEISSWLGKRGGR